MTVVVVVAILGPATLAVLFSLFARLGDWATLASAIRAAQAGQGLLPLRLRHLPRLDHSSLGCPAAE